MRFSTVPVADHGLGLAADFYSDDLEPFAKICANLNVMRYVGDGKPVGLDVIAEKMPQWIELYEKTRFDGTCYETDQ